ncbi:hypothetical protein [Methylobacterium iners]|uniref:Uncharacterized protein n=1 Tax=Methylobacterium iners TaxID=418707 RepID=A0ABQ4RY19_9HYPH|nr:hypothetical protein [Methylobacterium iners]GJD94533.1 hypothetical protein OCOJLMKI_1736 [Methylobacterium iners]
MPSKDDRLEQVARMADLLADRILNAQILGREVKDSDILALLEASLLLSEYGQETPPLVMQVVRRLDAAKSNEGAEASEEERQDIERLAHSLRPFQAREDQEG